MGAPVLIGAGVGALGSTLMGGSPLKGALLGGSLGSGYGGIKSLMEGGSFLQGAMPFASSSVGGASTGIKLIPEVVSPTATAMSFTPTAANLGTGVQLSQVPMYGSGAGFGITNLADYATGAGTNLMAAAKPSWLDSITSQQVGNVIGGANVAQQYMQRRPIPQAPAGGVSRGNPPPAAAVQELIAQIQAQQPRRRLSLLVG